MLARQRPTWSDVGKLWRRLLLAAYYNTLCGLNLVQLLLSYVTVCVFCVVTLLPCMADCCMLYNMCKVERFVLTILNKKLIRRWDSERELSLRRHRTRTTKYNRLVDKFRHRSTRRLRVGTMFTKFSEITQCNGHYAVQGHSRSPILVPLESSYTTSY